MDVFDFVFCYFSLFDSRSIFEYIHQHPYVCIREEYNVVLDKLSKSYSCDQWPIILILYNVTDATYTVVSPWIRCRAGSPCVFKSLPKSKGKTSGFMISTEVPMSALILHLLLE